MSILKPWGKKIFPKDEEGHAMRWSKIKRQIN